jgi:Tfp pilus assembly protein PilN
MVVVEIAGPHLNLVAVIRGWRGFELTHSMKVENFEQRDPLALRPAVDEFFRHARVDKTQTMVVVPRSEVVLRSFEFPQAVLENLPNIMGYQIENFEPLDRSELAFTYEALPSGGGPKLDVMVAMGRRDRIEHWQKFFTSLGITPRALVAGSSGLARVMQWEKSVAARENNFLLRVGNDDFEWIATLRGRLLRSLRFPLESSEPRAAQWMREFDRLSAELHLERKDVHNLFVAGIHLETALADLRAQDASLPIHAIRTPGALQCSLKTAEFSEISAAVGAGMQALSRGGMALNLMAGGEVSTLPRWRWAPAYALCGVALLLVAAGFIQPFVEQHQFLGQLDAELVRLRPQVRQVERLSTETDELHQKAQTLANLKGADARNLEALREISELLPDTAWLNEFNLRGDTVEISGWAESASTLVQTLSQSPLFKDVTLASGITRTQQGKEVFRIRAKMQF